MLAVILLLVACAPVDSDTAPVGDPAVDADADGVMADVDCNDADKDVFPGAAERCDGVDSDCDGSDEVDADSDGALDCAVCDEAGYFGPLAATEDLGRTLDELTDGVTCTYDRSREYLFNVIDNHDGYVECVYTGQKFPIDDYPPDWDLVNTEHTWPQSQGASAEPAKCDLGHLFPVETDANTVRGDHPFGIVTSGVSWSEGGSKLGKDASGNLVFEPRDSHKGNVARSMFYFAMQYDKSLSSAQLALLRDWDTNDPVTAADRAREHDILRAQKEANPFVACPGLVAAWADAGTP